MPINQVSELLEVSDVPIADLPTSNYKSFYTITFQNMDTIGSKPVLKNDFAPWICNNFLNYCFNKVFLYERCTNTSWSDRRDKARPFISCKGYA